MRTDSRWSFLGALAVAMLAHGPEAVAAQDGKLELEAEIAVRRLAALRAVAGFVQSDEIITPSQARFVARIAADHNTHRVYTNEKALQAAHEVFEEAFQDSLKAVAKELDPNSEGGLLSWMQKKMDERLTGRETSLRQRAEDRLANDLKDPGGKLLGLYRGARQRVAEDQVKRAISGMGKALTGLAPTEEEIVAAAADPAARAALVGKIGQRVTARAGAGMLEEAESYLLGRAESLVENGLIQYREQAQEARSARTTGFSRDGIADELKEIVRKVIELRKSRANPDHNKVYEPFFDHGDTTLGWEAAGRFERKLAAEVRKLEPGIPESLRVQAYDAISRSPREHANLNASIKAFWPEVNRALMDRVASVYSAAAAGANLACDKPHLASLKAQATDAFGNPGAKCRSDWELHQQKCKDRLSVVLKEVRAKLAARDAAYLCPALMNGQWRPLGPEIQAHPVTKLDRNGLRALSIWQRQAPSDAELIEEAWGLLLTTAGQRFQVGLNALSGQQNCVHAIRDAMTARILANAGLGAAHWRDQYAERTLADWRRVSAGKPEGTAYTELFAEVLEQIRGIVDKALQSEVAEAQRQIAKVRLGEVGKAVDAEARQLKYAAIEPHYTSLRKGVLQDWKSSPLSTQHPDLRTEVDADMRRQVQRLVDEQHKRLDQLTAQAVKDAKEKTTRIEDLASFRDRAAKELGGAIPMEKLAALGGQEKDIRVALVEAQQGRLAEEVRPEVEADVQARLRAGQTLKPEDVASRYATKVATRWAEEWAKYQDVLTQEDKDLRASVRQRIDGIVAKLVSRRVSLHAEVREAQSDLVGKYRPEMRETVQSEYRQGTDVMAHADEYKARGENLVEQAWKKDPLSLQPGYEGLLPEINDEIGGMVSRVLKEVTSATGSASPGTEDGSGGQQYGAAQGTGTGSGGKGPADKTGTSTSPVGPSSAGESTETGGQGTSGQQGSGPTAGRPSDGGGTGGGIGFWVGSSLLTLLLALLLFLVLRRFSRRRGARRNAAGLGLGSPLARPQDEVVAIQMDLIRRMLEVYEPGGNVRDLADLRACTREFLDEVQLQWDRLEGSKVMPNLALDALQLAVGGVFYVVEAKAHMNKMKADVGNT